MTSATIPADLTLVSTRNEAAYAAVLAESERTGLPKRYLTDLTKHLRESLGEAPENTPFVVLLRESGVDYINLTRSLASEMLQDWKPKIGDPENVFLFWDGAALAEKTADEIMASVGENVVKSEHTLRENAMSVPSFSELLASLPYSVRSSAGSSVDYGKRREREEFLFMLPYASVHAINAERETEAGEAKWEAFLNPKQSVEDALRVYYDCLVHQFTGYGQNPKFEGGVTCVLRLFEDEGNGTYSAYFAARTRWGGELVANGAIYITDGRVSMHT